MRTTVAMLGAALLAAMASKLGAAEPTTAEGPVAAATMQDADRAARRFAEQVRPLLVKRCQKCHHGEKPKGDFHLDRLSADFSAAANSDTWQAVFEQLDSGVMPPPGEPRPSAEELAAIGQWIADGLKAAEEGRVDAARVVLRRLNRAEYENTIRDLLGNEIELKAQLPPDGSADGFDNAGAALHTSSFLMERYLEAADMAFNQAISNRPKPPAAIQKRYSLKESHPIRSTSESVYRFHDDTVVCFCSSEWHNVSLSKFYPSEGGFYRFRISASAYQSGGKPVTFRVTAGGRRLSGKSGLVGYFDAPPEPRIIEFVQYMEPKTTIAMLPYGLPNAQTVNKIGAETYEGPGLAVQWIEVEGPLNDTWPPESHRRIFGDLPQKSAPAYNFRDRVEVVSDEPLEDAERILRRFARRAFRRKVAADDVIPYVEIVKDRLDADYTFEQAMRAALKGVLLSPEFLFLREAPGRLDDNALASRLSYFLWSTMPDEELLDLAAQGKLHEAGVLPGQIERMLDDPKAAAFTENFVGQWLNLREIDFTEPSHLLYPEFDHMLKVSMIRESELFFQEVLKHDLSITNFVASDFTMLNGRLARHYGIRGVEGWEFRKTMLPPNSHRGGVLTMASVLKVTANGTTTSPVVRGAWVLDRILGTPPSPPPDDVPALDPDIRGATTMREQLVRHRSLGACASCHVKIDPPGFALESFDCIGGWRDRYRITGNGEAVTIDGRKMPYRLGKPVEPADVLPDGRAFADIDEFKQLLLADKHGLARAMTTRLVSFATGAAPTAADRPAIDAIVARAAQHNYGLRTLIHEIVASELFQNK
jgi:hypothetical protein